MRKILNTQKSTSLFQISRSIIYEELLVLFESARDINIKHKIALRCNIHWNKPPVVGSFLDGWKLATSFTFKSFYYHPFLTIGWTEWTLPPFKQTQRYTGFETSFPWSVYQESLAVSGHLLLLGCSERSPAAIGCPHNKLTELSPTNKQQHELGPSFSLSWAFRWNGSTTNMTEDRDKRSENKLCPPKTSPQWPHSPNEASSLIVCSAVNPPIGSGTGEVNAPII